MKRQKKCKSLIKSYNYFLHKIFVNLMLNELFFRRRVQNVPLPLHFPKEFHEGLWGGEAIVQGFTKKHRYARRAPHFWFPTLRKSVVYSEVLDKYMNTVVTIRTINLIHEHYGFDHYLLKVC